MKLGKLSKTLLAVAMMTLILLSGVSSAFAASEGVSPETAAPQENGAAVSANAGFWGTVYTLKSGISFKLPAEYTSLALWDQMDDSAPGLDAQGYSSAEAAQKWLDSLGAELFTFSDNASRSTGYMIIVNEQDAPDDLSADGLMAAVRDWLREYDPTSAPVRGCGREEINGIPVCKLYAETPAGKDYMYNIIIAADTGKLYHINFWADGVDISDGYFDKLVRDVISTLTVSDELRSHILSVTDEPFAMIEGEHPGAIWDNVGAKPAAPVQKPTAPVQKTKSLYQKIMSFEFPIHIILIALILILVYGIKFPGKGKKWQDDPLSLESSKAIQGFCAVAIIIHHLAQDLMKAAGPLSFFSELGVLFVGVFFFFSGYGLFTSLKSKDNYLDGFLKKRLSTILVPFYVCTLIFITFACIAGQTFNLIETLVTVSGWILINPHMWYIVEIAVLYLAFFIIYKLIKNRSAATAVMSVFVALLTAGSLLLGHGKDMSSKFWFQGEWWYNTTFLFIFGIIVSQYQDKLRSFARKAYYILLPVFAALTVGFGFLTKRAITNWSYWSEVPGNPAYGDKLRCLSVQLPWVLFFVAALLLIMMKVKFGNRVLKFLGSISLELYLIHNLFLQGLSRSGGTMAKVTSSSLYILLTILFSVGFATIISGFDKYIIGLINGKSKNTLAETETSHRIHSIDVMRIVMSFLVVAIHLPFIGKTGEVFITYGKTAVPFFLAVCGYMLWRDDSEAMQKRLKKQTLKIFLLYAGSNVLYGLAAALKEYTASGNLNGFKAMYFSAGSIKNFLLYNVWFSEHLWFLGSLFYALVILIVLNRLKALNYVMWSAPLLIAAYVVLSYMGAAQPYVLRNALLVGLPYVMMGMLIRRYEDKLMKIKAPVLWVAAAVLCVTAILELDCRKQGTGVPFISCEFLVYVILLLCLKYPWFGRDTLAERMGRDLSLPIYILHLLPIMFIPIARPYMTTYGAITVFVLTALFSALYVTVKKGAKSLLN